MTLSLKRAMRPTASFRSKVPTGRWRNAPFGVRRKGTRIKTIISLGFSIFALLVGSVGLTGCDISGEAEQEGVELEKNEEAIEGADVEKE